MTQHVGKDMPDSLNAPSLGPELPDFSNGTRLPLPDLCLHQSFESWVDRDPERPAIITPGGIISFGQLDGMGNRLAHRLLQLQIATEEPVGVLVDRSAQLPIAFLGILKAGGTYVPLLADLPEQRLANMAAQAGIRLLIALDGHQPPPALLAVLADNGQGRPVEVLRPPALDDADRQDWGRPHLPCQPGQLAAILFTSGSTGKPKGVLIQHVGCQNMALGHALAQGIRETDRLLLSSAPSFILGFRELCLPLALGCAWVPASRALLDRPGDLLDSMARHQVSVALLTPSYLKLLGGAVPAGLRLILTAGERPNPEDARHYARHVDYWNMHGATELCGTFAMHKVSPTDEGAIPSGRPFPNTTILLVDEQGAPVPAGAEGEILVLSPGIARGYLDQPDLTAESFVDTPFGRAYRTRDLGRWTQTGELLTLGRAGDVVKVSGQSVALGEIERVLLAQDGVRAAAIVQHRGRLVGFVEPKPGVDLSELDWQAALSAKLPAYMVPALVLTLPQLPIASAGKVDRSALLALAETDWNRGQGQGGPPQGPLESRIAAIWAEVLGLSAAQIGRQDDFFRLGGSSLIAIQLGQRLQAAGLTASVRDILGSMTIAALAGRLSAAEEDAAGVGLEENPAATLGQVDFWVAASLGLPPAAAHVARVLRLSGVPADASDWQNAWVSLLRHHPALRTGLFSDHDGTVRLRSLPADAPALDVTLETRHFASEAEAGAFVAAQTAQPFDLTQPPLSRAGLIRIGDDAPLFWFVLHHALVDGMSAGQLQQDLLSLLTGRALAPALDGPRLAARAERRHLASPDADRDRAYWLDKLAALPEEAFEELPGDRRRSDEAGAVSAPAFQRQLDAGLVARLTALANRQGAGLHALLLALLAMEMRRRTGRRQLLLGSGIATRPAGTENQLGHFVNLLPLPLAVPAGPRLCELLQDAQSILTGAVKHGLYPAGSIIRDLRQQQKAMRPAGRMGLVDVALTANPGRSTGNADAGGSLTPVTLAGDGSVPAAGLDLSFSHEPTTDGGVLLSLVWNASLFQPATAEAWLTALAGWAEWLAADTARLDGPLPDLLPAERQWLNGVEPGAAQARAPLPAHRLVEAIIDRIPDQPAIITRTGSTSYALLEAQANRIAQALLAAGLGLEQPVGVLADNGPWLPAATLGIWKAGGVHLPLAVEMPAERVAFILADAGARHLLLLPGAEAPAGLPDGVTLIRPAELTGDAPRPAVPLAPTATAYIIYTSGTTGAPKGTKVRHDGMINAILSTLEAAGCTPGDRVALVATPAFDASLWEMGLGLLHGLPLVPVTRIEREDPWGVKDLYRDLGVTIAFHAPSYLRVSQDKPYAPGMRVLLVGGEAPSHEDVAHHPGIAFWNCYGPTETSIIVSLGRIAPDHPADRPLPVGRPLPGDVISIRDADGARVPPGCTGEVWLGGVGVGGGYLNNPQQQAKAFIDTAEGRFYRSGDLGRWSADGLLELAGRIDHQVKLHGQRVEPAEIEQHLLAHASVRQAAVIVDKGAGDTKLLRGFVHLHPNATPLGNEEWRGFLAGRLPPHMVPATIIDVPGIPVTPNGKVDRLRLLAILRERRPEQAGAASRTAPQGALEQRIASAWARLLNLGSDGLPVAREDNFFALGGTSLLAVSLAHQLAPALGWPVTPRDLFAAPVLTDFAARLAAGKGAPPLLAAMLDDRATEGEREFWVAQQAGLDTSGHIIPAIRRVMGPMPERARWEAAWQALVQRQPGLRLGFSPADDGALRRVFATEADLGKAAGLHWAEAADLDAACIQIRQNQLLAFDMAKPPLWRAGLVQVGQDGGWLFWLSLHHAIGDGRSLGLIFTELQALLQGQVLAPLTADPATSAAREQAYLSGPDLAADAVWWSDQLAAVPDEAFLPLPLDFPRRLGADVATHRFQLVLEPALAEGLRGLARQHAVSLYALLVSLLAVEMARRTGRQHLMLGTSVSTPESAAEAALVQYGVNMLPLPLRLDPAAPLATLLRGAQQALAGGLQHARYPFARLYADFWRQRPGLRDPLRFPLFDVAVTENPPAPVATDGVRLERLGIGADGYELTHSAHGQDLLLIHEALADGGIALEWHVNASLFSRDSAAAWLGGLVERLTLLATRPDLPALQLAGLLEGAAPPPPAPMATVTSTKNPALPGLEQDIAALWASLLGIAPPAREDNFFALGGNSLLAIGMAHKLASRLGRPVSARDLFSAPVLADFAARLQQGASTDRAATGFDGRRATVGEREFWTAQQAGLDTAGFTMPLVRRVRGPVPDIARWRTAWAQLVARHPALRCRLHEGEDGVLYRDILPALPVDAALELAEQADHAQAMAHIRARIAAPLDLAQPPLWRVGLVHVADHGDWLFWLAQHHATGDGRSLGLIMAELLALLRDEPLPSLTATPEMISSREQAYLAGEAASDAGWWRDLLSALPAAAFDDWALDLPRGTAITGSHRHTTRLDAAETASLLALARQHGTSLHALLTALLAQLVRQRTGRGDFLIGTTATLPETAAEAAVVHYGVNMLPLAFRATGDAGDFASLLRHTAQELTAALAHGRYPFARMYHDFWATHPGRRQPDRYPLFDIAITENPVSPRPVADDELRLERLLTLPADGIGYERMHNPPGQDMVLTHERLVDGGLMLDWQTNAALYHVDISRFWLEGLVEAARWLAAHGAQATIPSLPPAQQRQLAGWEQGPARPRPPLTFARWFEMLVDQPGQAERPALLTADGPVSYGLLERQANRLAHRLIAAGVQPGQVVAVLTRRSAHLPAALLAIWKAGAIYLPLTADLPADRLCFMAADAGAVAMLALDGIAPPAGLDLPQIDTSEPAPDGRPAVAGGPDDAAYILYTSGSTGQPKGVVVSHGSYLNLLLGAVETYGLTAEDRCLGFAAPSFDVSLSDIGIPLAAGAALCPVPSDRIDQPAAVAALIREQRISVADLTPTYLRLLETDSLSGLRILVTGGEAPLPADVARLAGRVRYFNAYGPTENAITSTMGCLSAAQSDRLDCGRPLPNTGVEIRDPVSGSRLPPGSTGEIWLAGAGLAQAYLNRPDLTEKAFVQTPEGRRYRTGDLGRWRGDGGLEVLGRIDQQVKLNGIRIELGEIEAAITRHPGIIQAVAAVEGKAGERQSLWAFIHAASDAPLPDSAGWRLFLGDILPAYMIPAAIQPVSAIPVTASGKVDRTALLAGLSMQERPAGGTPPQPGLEQTIATLWAELLRSGPVRREDDFFGLGGHSLLAIALCHRLEGLLSRPVPARLLFADPVLAGFAARVAAYLAEPVPVIQAQPSDIATEGEREFWTAQQAGLETRGFTITLTLAVDGPVPAADKWEAAWTGLTARHPALRTRYELDEETDILKRIVAVESPGRFTISRATDVATALAEIRAEQGRPFDMATGPLWRAGLTEVAEEKPIFWLALHHAVGDGASLGLLLADLTALLAGQSLPAPSGSFADSAGRERTHLLGLAGQADADWWRQKLAAMAASGEDGFADWPTDRPRPPARTAGTGRGSHTLRLCLTADQAQGLRRLARSQGASLHALLLTLLGLEVRRRTGRQDFLLGTAASTRASAAEAGIVGYYVTLLPLAFHLSGVTDVAAALAATRSMLADALAHSAYPFARIARDFRQDHPGLVQPARYPLFDMAVTENPAVTATDSNPDALRFRPAESSVLPEAGRIAYDLRHNAPAQDMVLVHEGLADGGLSLSWFVKADLYDRETAEAWLTGLVGQMLALLDRPLDQPLPRLLPAELARLAPWEQGERLTAPADSVAARFSQLARQQPDRPALITQAGAISYAAMEGRANALAHRLIEQGLRPGQTVGVYTERSATLPLAVLAIWKAGGCYMPLTHGMPADRLRFMADNAGITLLLALDGLTPPPALLETTPVLLRPEAMALTDTATPPALETASDSPAYILHTSGSTGVPKGVVLSQGGLVNLALGLVRVTGATPDDRALLIASPSFDLWISDLLMVWGAGGAIVPATKAEMDDITGMKAMLGRLGITMATMAPSYLRLFEQAEFPALRFLMTVGEPPVAADARFYAARLAYFNGYGPTETTAAAAIGRIDPDDDPLPAGRPLPNSFILILDAQGERVPPGSVGEIWVGGAGVGIGYLNRPDLTEQSFRQTPHGRMYRTGDLGRWRHDGQLLVLGRMDGQVKLRGQRVELGEIEQALARHPGVRHAAVLVRKAADGAQSLWGFVVPGGSAETLPDAAGWQDFLGRGLPGYMIPSGILALPALPVNLAGKIDRKALLATLEERLAAGELTANGAAAAEPPKGSVETAVAAIWADILGRASPSRTDDFFHLGGDSLRAIATITRLRKHYSVRINDLYEHPVLADFARQCRPRADHLRDLIGAAGRHWRDYRDQLPAYEAAREATLAQARADYELRNSHFAGFDPGQRADYGHVLLTGATGYLGTYLLRELLQRPDRAVTVLVRAADDGAARQRLLNAVAHYFGTDGAAALLGHGGLSVRAGNLRHPDLGLGKAGFTGLAASVDAILHSAANVSHIGHYSDFQADNVAATAHLLDLAEQHGRTSGGRTADLHLISTLSVCGRPPEDGFRLFTEYDPAPDGEEENYYVRSKQEAERLVLRARDRLANASIHRVGNVVFAADGGPLQRNIKENAFFRLMGALARLGAVPDDSHLWLCHVDRVAQAVLALAESPALANLTHHVEHARRDTLADFITGADGVGERVAAMDFGCFLDKVAAAVDAPALETALAEILEGFGLHRGISPQARGRRLELASDRTQQFLRRLGVVWPAVPRDGQAAMVAAAHTLFTEPAGYRG
ncbi:non-ribosomal peptide synthetase [Niveispirillum sp. BGYR6]|uniref:non-ribosomal peptide synthetase n=1 Tax=Niveispirillum sp. BGYR6 TaxID=2971249 RepID=UPI0022B9A7BE|nr:non-ribosomal peptide synthetase [Niveispirillum sp. BGYR6]MDG5493327.1 amino acid adenylation domain-containing protein [Niveispirillum sp. BGYR6]